MHNCPSTFAIKSSHVIKYSSNPFLFAINCLTQISVQFLAFAAIKNCLASKEGCVASDFSTSSRAVTLKASLKEGVLLQHESIARYSIAEQQSRAGYNSGARNYRPRLLPRPRNLPLKCRFRITPRGTARFKSFRRYFSFVRNAGFREHRVASIKRTAHAFPSRFSSNPLP